MIRALLGLLALIAAPARPGRPRLRWRRSFAPTPSRFRSLDTWRRTPRG